MLLAEFNQKYDIVRNARGMRAIEKTLTSLGKPSKFKAVKTLFDGIVFDSAKEARRFAELKLLERSGTITEFVSNAENVAKKLPKIRYELVKRNGNKVWYEPDFEYIERGLKVVEDCKGFRTKVYLSKKKLMLKIHEIDVRET
jgi:Protein of unknown function (DUF1064)